MSNAPQAFYKAGTAFEKLVVETLRPLGFQLHHCGKTGDKGIDFFGFWVLPDKKVPIAGQCKFSLSSSNWQKKKSTLVELKNAVELYEVDQTQRKLACSHGSDSSIGMAGCTVGMLVFNGGFTRALMRHLNSSNIPLIVTQINISRNDKAEENERIFAEQVSEACWAMAGKPVRRELLLEPVDRTRNQPRSIQTESVDGPRLVKDVETAVSGTSSDYSPEACGTYGLGGCVSGFLMNNKAKAIVGDVSVNWLHDTSCSNKQVSSPEVILLYNGEQVCGLKQ